MTQSQFLNEIRQRMLQTGSYNVPLMELERCWVKQFDADETRAADFIGWCKRNRWQATIKNSVVEIRR